MFRWKGVFNDGLKNRCQIPSHPSAICCLLWVTLGAHPSWHQFSWEALMCDQKCVLMDGLTWDSRKTGPQASVGSGLPCCFGHFALPPHPPPSPLSFRPSWIFTVNVISHFTSCSAGSSNTEGLQKHLCLGHHKCVVHASHRWQSSKKGEGWPLDSSGKRWVAFLVFSLGTLWREPCSHPDLPTHFKVF